MTFAMPKESIVFLGGIILSSVLIPLSLPILRRLGVVDHPNARSSHLTAIPRGAGLVVVATFLIVLFAYCQVAQSVPLMEQGRLEPLLWAVALLAAVGFLDDMRGVSPLIKLTFQIGCAGICVAKGFVMPLPSLFGDYQQFVEQLFSLCWFVGVINAVNFIDGSDGLATTLSTLSMLIFVGISRIVPRELSDPSITKTINLLGLAGAGSALPFLLYNVSPAKCFLGDAGSTFFGLLLALLGTLIAQYDRVLAATPVLSEEIWFRYSFLAVPWLVLLVPIADGIRVTGGRVFRGKSPFRPDNRHLHHVLHNAGLSPNQILFLVSLAVTGTGMSAAILVRSHRAPFLMMGVCVLLVYGLLWFFKSSYRARRFVGMALNRRLFNSTSVTEGYENPASFKERFEQELARVKRHNGALSVLVVNSRPARAKEASPLENPSFLTNLLRALRREDVKARFSNERLAFILVETDKGLADRVGARIEKLFDGIRQGESAGLEIGIGLAAYPTDGATVQALLQRAEANAVERLGRVVPAEAPAIPVDRSPARRRTELPAPVAVPAPAGVATLVPSLASAATSGRNGSGEVKVLVEPSRLVSTGPAPGVPDSAALVPEVTRVPPGLPAGAAPATASLATGELTDGNGGGTLPRWQSPPPAGAAVPPARGNGTQCPTTLPGCPTTLPGSFGK